ncbi:recombinase family protein [Rhodoblastus sp.]|jgi:hypothetical protein|uniref:recombinase family protein n=1 Tax=Rhodoblastus sp. TaxID=1962975 RepID=UPI003F981128
MAAKRVAGAHADKVLPAIREAQAAGAKSFRQIADALTARGIATRRGGTTWEERSVANILKRT